MAAIGQSNGNISVWDIRNQSKIFSVPTHQNSVKNMAFSEKGIYLASCGKNDSVVQIWDLRCMNNGPAASIKTGLTKYMIK
jgi:WD40 repeat protein